MGLNPQACMHCMLVCQGFIPQTPSFITFRLLGNIRRRSRGPEQAKQLQKAEPRMESKVCPLGQLLLSGVVSSLTAETNINLCGRSRLRYKI